MSFTGLKNFHQDKETRGEKVASIRKESLINI